MPNRLPLASAISPATGSAPLEPLKLTSVVGSAGVDWRGDRARILDLEHCAVAARRRLSCRTGRRWRRRSAPPSGSLDISGQRGRGAGVDRRGDRASILDLEHRAVAVQSALGRAEQVAVGVGGQPRTGSVPLAPLKLNKVVN